jgi:hypothetical protein
MSADEWFNDGLKTDGSVESYETNSAIFAANAANHSWIDSVVIWIFLHPWEVRYTLS